MADSNNKEIGRTCYSLKTRRASADVETCIGQGLAGEGAYKERAVIINPSKENQTKKDNMNGWASAREV